jgi:transcriptional regulator with XRE-family HTH domain
MKTNETVALPKSRLDSRELGSRIKATRQTRRLSQRGLAELAGLRPERVSRLEAGRVKEPRLREMVDVAAALGTGIQELVFDFGTEGTEPA